MTKISIILPQTRKTPRFGVLPTRTEPAKKSTFKRKPKHKPQPEHESDPD